MLEKWWSRTTNFVIGRQLVETITKVGSSRARLDRLRRTPSCGIHGRMEGGVHRQQDIMHHLLQKYEMKRKARKVTMTRRRETTSIHQAASFKSLQRRRLGLYQYWWPFAYTAAAGADNFF